jgi:hypothetical protein
VVNVISQMFAGFLRNLQSRVTGACEEIESLKQRRLLVWCWREFTGHSLIHSPLTYHTLAGFQEWKFPCRLKQAVPFRRTYGF